MFRATAFILLAASLAASAVVSSGAPYHPEDHPAVALFKRQGSGATAPVGSPEWKAKYPQGPIAGTPVPAAWLTAYDNAVKAGKIPQLAPSVMENGNPTYPGMDPMSPEIRSATYQARGDDTIEKWDAPANTVVVSFDDGPIANSSATLYDFLQTNNQSATHFFIGSNILENSDLAMQAFADPNQQIGVHTWTHPYLTSLSDHDVVVELGWTMQIIHDLTGGRVPSAMRPPYGDIDERVRAIAAHVFGKTIYIWNFDTDDWKIGEVEGVTQDGCYQKLIQWYGGAQNPGLMILEHELSQGSVQAFIDSYPTLKQHNWIAKNAGNAYDKPWYLNSVNNTAPVISLDVAAPASSIVPSPTAAAPATPSNATSTKTGATASATHGTTHNGAAGNGVSASFGAIAAFACAAFALL
ncbi:carbohydrate esterase family 4 protein [Botryobasidium botryosum FD-172 SS1]|uniref:chitin deacetylase n=1 Tax=Botryobasidium botryosum (strain FD-172 SS1) TaxID=930990 RepID=A0A067MIP9_BOTB1|nr:carbohydrate esterase family 4 protein [Botryobasidium botryosum FD-172 SS1]